MKKKNILVTGSAGFMGSHLFDYLHEKYGKMYSIFGVDDLSGGFMRNVSRKEFFKKLDLRNRKKVSEFIEELRPEIVFHFAADATEGRSQFTPLSALDRNLVAYVNLLVPCIKYGLKKMILISSMSVYGSQQIPFKESFIPRPDDVYGVTKASMEDITRIMASVYGFKYLIFRPHNVYGPRQNLSDPYRNVVGIFINCLLQGKRFYIYGDGEQKRAFSYIDDITSYIAEASMKNELENEIFNIGSDEVVTINELSQIILEEFFGRGKIPKKFLPAHLPPRPQEVKFAFCDHTKAKELLNFKPRTSLREGIRKTIEWARSIGPQKFKYLDSLELYHRDIPRTWLKKLY